MATSSMTIVLAVLNVLQGLGVAWIANRQYTVKKSLDAYNGTIHAKLREIERNTRDPPWL